MEPQPAQDPAERFRRTEPQAAPGAPPPPGRSPLAPGLWFLFGAATASVGWYGYGLMQASMMRSAAAAMAQAGSNGQLGAQLTEFMHQAQRSTERMADAAQGSGSSLDLVSGPGSQAPAEAAPPVISPEQVQSINKAGADMLGSLMPLMNNPQMLKNLPPEKRREIQGLSQVLMSMQATMATGKPLDEAQLQQVMRTVQSMQLTHMPPGAPAPAKPERR